MPSLSQSPILQALGYAIANSLWQMAMVWIVYVLLNSIFKFKSELKFRIAVAAQIIGFSWFLVTLQFYYRQCSQALELAESIYRQAGDQETYVVATEKGSMLSYFIKAEQVLPYLSVAYLLLLVFLTIRWYRAYRYTQLVRLNGLHKIDVDWKLFVSKVAGQLGIKQSVRIFLSEIVQSPVTIGFLKPVILIPIASINHLTAQQLEAVILHELAHIKRHDYLLNILLSIIELGLFFNPFTRLITKSISKERENSCDDWVLQYQYNPSMYAEALLRIAVLQKSPAMAMYAVKTKGELLSRVQRMVHQKDSSFNYRHQLTALLLMTGILASIAWFDPSAMKAQQANSLEAQQAVVLEPLAAKINNPLFNPIFFLNEPLRKEVKETVAKANESHISHLKKELRTQTREISFPRVMAPVAIENLKELEKKIASVNRDVKRSMQNFPAHLKLAQGQVFHFDTLHFKNQMAAFNNLTFLNQPADMYWQGMDEAVQELQKSQKAIEEALRKGTMSKKTANTQLAEITEALKKLQETKLPQMFAFAPGGDNNFFYRQGVNWYESDEEHETRERERVAEKERTVSNERKRTNSTEIKGTNVKLRKAVVDSLRKRFTAKAMTIKIPAQAYNGYVTLSQQGAPFVVVDGKSLGNLKQSPGVPVAATLPRLFNQDAMSFTFSFSDSEDECEKANSNERSRRVIVTGQGKSKTTNGTKPKAKATTGTCTATASSTQKDKEEVIVVDVQLQ